MLVVQAEMHKKLQVIKYKQASRKFMKMMRYSSEYKQVII